MPIFYTYLIGWSHYNKWYYGVRYSKNSNPNELWKTYFTSSEYVTEFRKLNGEPDIILIRKQFNDPQKARLWEHKVLKKMKVVDNKNWLNKTDNICFDSELMSEIGKTKIGELNNFYGKLHSEKTKEKLSDIQKSLMTEEKRKKISDSIKKKHANGEYSHIYTKDREQKISKSNKGQIPWNKGKTLTDEHKKKISESEKITKSKLKENKE